MLYNISKFLKRGGGGESTIFLNVISIKTTLAGVVNVSV